MHNRAFEDDITSLLILQHIEEILTSKSNGVSKSYQGKLIKV